MFITLTAVVINVFITFEKYLLTLTNRILYISFYISLNYKY